MKSHKSLPREKIIARGSTNTLVPDLGRKPALKRLSEHLKAGSLHILANVVPEGRAHDREGMLSESCKMSFN